jgi:hypothetical protein
VDVVHIAQPLDAGLQLVCARARLAAEHVSQAMLADAIVPRVQKQEMLQLLRVLTHAV